MLRKRQIWRKPETQSHGSSLPPSSLRRLPEGPKIAGLPSRTFRQIKEVLAMRRFLFLLPLILAGCGSDGSDIGTPLQVEQHAPQIGNLIISPDIAAYMEGDGSVSATAQFNYSDNGRDIAEMHVEMSDGTSLTLSLAGLDTTVSGRHTAQFEISTATIGPCTVEIWLVDEAGDSSNRLAAEFEVIDMPAISEWTNRLRVPLPLNNIAWDGQVFIAVGYGGTILTSVDGIDWVARESTTDDALYAVAAFGADIYAVGGPGVLLSTDHGETWTVKARPDAFIGTAVAANSSQIVVMGTVPDLGIPRITISEDRGETWQTMNFPGSSGDLIYREGLFITPSSYGVLVSTDGKQWNEFVVHEEEPGMNEIVVHDDSQFFVATDDGTVFSSFDAFNWTELSTPLADVDFMGAAWSGTQLMLAGGVRSYQNRYDGTYRPIGISSSDGGASWDIFGIDSSYESHGIAWGNGRFVSVGTSVLSDEGAIYTTD